jgi:hypothetical protein
MRGRPQFNFPAFDKLAEILEGWNHVVYNPAQRDREAGFDETDKTGHEDLATLENFDHRQAMAQNMEWICRSAECVWMLPGWSKSTGATAERALGLALGLAIEGSPA